MKKTIGILGGMGPEATTYFYELITKNTKASKDQEHIPVIIYSNPQIPPRTEAIIRKGPSPLPLLLEGVRILKHAGADFIVMPCVTAHYYYHEIRHQEKIPFLNLLDETANYVHREMIGLKKIGLLASTGTIKSGLFLAAFTKVGIEVIGPDEGIQEKVMDSIFGKLGIKAGFISDRNKEILENAVMTLIGKGAVAAIAGCTEIPLVLKEEDIIIPLIEPLEILAKASIVRAGYELKDKMREKTLD
jgi:aspartate racemase